MAAGVVTLSNPACPISNSSWKQRPGPGARIAKAILIRFPIASFQEVSSGNATFISAHPVSRCWGFHIERDSGWVNGPIVTNPGVHTVGDRPNRACVLIAFLCLNPGLSVTAQAQQESSRSFVRSVALETSAATSANVSIGDVNADGHQDIVLVKGSTFHSD